MKRFLLTVLVCFAVICLPACAGFFKATPHILKALSDYQEEYGQEKCETQGVKVIVIDTARGDENTFCFPPYPEYSVSEPEAE